MVKSPLDTAVLPLVCISISAVLVLRYVFVQLAWRARRRGRPLPPGPKSLSLIGNVSLMRRPEIWRSHRDLCDKYGEIVYVPVLGQSIVILGSPRAIFEVLDKRSSVTSSRVETPLIPLIGKESAFSLMPYGQWWRRHRRACWQHFLPAATANHLPAQRDATQLFLLKLLKQPARLCEHIRYTFSAAIFKVTYGIDVSGANDQRIALLEKSLEAGLAFTPGRYLVEMLPFLQYVPEWVPCARFQKEFAVWRNATHSLNERLILETKDGMEHGTTSHSVVAGLLEELAGNSQQEAFYEELEVIKGVGLTTCEAGADTTFSTLQIFFLAMALHPTIQKKAQAELDAVVGPDRLPDHSDRANLPYITAIVKESLRWQNVLPFGLPHATTEDMEYDGYFIPAGTLLIPNTWACLHDAEVYPEPERFNPERFHRDGKLDPNVCDPAKFTFGYGRRVCPGRYYAEASLFINMAMVLHVFDITPPLDTDGKAILTEVRMTNGLLSYPVDCRCTITPRSEKAKQLILSTGVTD